MIDIHSHVLPEVDDGSENIVQSLEMLKEAERQGITDIVLTPHYRADYLTERADIEQKFGVLKSAAKENGINISLYLGQEIYAFRDMVKWLKEGKLLSMNGTKYVLVEFSAKQEMDIPETVYMLKSHGFIPIVAHLGRYFYADTETAREIKEIGGLVQINATSLCDSFFYRRKAMNFIKEGLVDFVASDVHFKRKNDMLKAYKIVSKKFGVSVADRLFTENAKILLNK